MCRDDTREVIYLSDHPFKLYDPKSNTNAGVAQCISYISTLRNGKICQQIFESTFAPYLVGQY